MALTPCAECGAEISDKAKSCPRCGAKRPINWRPAAKVGLLVSLPIVFVLAMGSSFVRGQSDGPMGLAMSNTEQRLRGHLKDPDSMVIRSSYPVVRRSSGGSNEHIYICGLVDGKNSFGAYAGAVRFVSYSIQTKESLKTYSVEVEDPRQTNAAHEEAKRSDFERMYWDPNCASHQG